MIMPMYCINLKRAVDRRKMIESLWNEQFGFSVTLFDAFDRRDLPHNAILPFDAEKCRNVLGRVMTDGEIACVTSHYLLCKQLLAEGHEQVIIMEDDVIPYSRGFRDKKDFFQRVERAVKTFPEIEIMFLHDPYQYRRRILVWIHKITSGRVALLNLFKPLKTKGNCMLLKKPPIGGRMMWYNRAGLEKMCKHLEKATLPTDFIYHHCFNPPYTLGVIRPHLAYERGVDTYIENERHKNPDFRRDFIA